MNFLSFSLYISFKVNPLISISKTWGFLHIKECFFSNNAGESQIYTEELGTLILSSVQCLFHNTNGITGSFLNGCFNLRTTMIRLIENLVIDRCVGVNLAGIKFFDNSTILAEMLPGVNQTGFVLLFYIFKV